MHTSDPKPSESIIKKNRILKNGAALPIKLRPSGYTINNKWFYEHFIIQNFEIHEQIKLINNMIEFINFLSNKYNTDINQLSIYHWSKFEPNIFNNISKIRIII